MRIVICVCAGWMMASAALAVGTSHWTHTSEADFKAGEFEHMVATNLGDVKLSRATRMLLEQDPRISAVYAMVEGPDKTIYAGTGPQGVLLAIRGDGVETVATLDDGTSIFSLLVDNQGRLLMGTGGDKGQILRIDKAGDAPREIFSAEGVQYIWALRQTRDGLLYAATGPEGQLFEIKPDGTSRVLFDSKENNLLCLIAAEPDVLYAGTDPQGLVYRINRKNNEVFVLYDAAESEIASLALDARGNLYAGTAQAGMELEGGTDDAGAAEQVGRPEGGTTSGVPIPSETPEDPNPPDMPDPNPGQPEPIPQESVPEPSPSPGTPGEERSQGSAGVELGAADSKAPGVPRERTSPGEAAVVASMQEAPGDGDGDDGNEQPPGDDGDGDDGDGDGDEQPIPAPGDEPADPPGGDDGAAADADDDDDAAGAFPGTAIGATDTGEAAPGGNAIYRIDRDGFVTEVFRMPVLVLSMLEKDGTLLVGTGSEGHVYQINPAADETIVLAKVDPKQVMSLLSASDGRVYLGLANVGGVATMSSGYAAAGSYTSPVLDALQVSRFGKLQLDGTLPKGTALFVQTRSGNVSEPGDVGWSKWSDEVPASRFLQITSPPARFFQYRLRMSSEDGKSSPVVEGVDAAYQVPNLAPQVTSVTITPTGAGDAAQAAPADMAGGTSADANRMQTIAWQASDPNQDAMEHALHFRSGSRGPWILLKEDLTEATFEWDTRSVADGRYEVRVTSSDAKANPRGRGRSASRVSDPIIVDNTPPVLGDIKANPAGAELRVELKVVDRTSTVASLEYSVDSNDDWQAVLPSDTIFDGPDETVSFAIPEVAPGQHQVTLRATDAKGNAAFQTIVVTIEAPAARR